VLRQVHHSTPLGLILGKGQSHARVTPLAKYQLKQAKLNATSFVTWQFDQKCKIWSWGEIASWTWMNFGG
jgi:hypothetical protein